MEKRIFKYSVGIIAFLGCLFLNDPTLIKENIISISIFLCQFVSIVIAFAGFIMVLTNINCKESNRVSVLAYGYCLVSFFMLVNLYMYIEAGRVPPIPVNYYKNRFFIEVLEVLFIYSALNIVNEKQSIKVWLFSLGATVLISLAMNLRDNSLLNSAVYTGYKVVYGVMIGVLFLIWRYSRKNTIYDKEFENIEKAMLLKSVYLMGTIINRAEESCLWMLACYITDTLHYVYVYRFIYKVTIRQFWSLTGERLNDARSELEQEEVEKHNLVLASYALKKYVDIIDHEAGVLRKKMEKSCGERSLQHLEKVTKNCRRLMRLSNNILDLGQMDLGNVTHCYKATNMNQLVEILVESILPYIESRGLEIEIEQSEKPIYCYVDGDEIERVLLNLISNAIKYSRPNGKIRIYINEKQERAYICVTDTGVGIPEEKLKNIFERFERVETGFSRSQEGSGLGLAIAKSIVEMHQGTINICSKEGKGTLVSLSFPIYQGQKNRQVDIRSKETLKRKIEVEFADLKR